MLGARFRSRSDRGRRRLIGFAGLLLVVAAATAAANTVDAVSWNHDASGNTVVVVDCAEPVDPLLVRSFPIADPPRIVVVIGDVERPVEPDVLAIADVNVVRLRLAYHGELSPAELYVILDLTADGVQLLELRPEGTRVVAVVGTPAAPPASPLPVDSPTPVPSTPVPTSTPAPSPTSTPTATQPPMPTPTPTPTTQAAPEPARSPTPGFTDRAAPPVVPTAEAPATAGTTTTAPAGDAIPFVPPSPVPPTAVPEPETATEIIDIAASDRGDGSTLLRITGNGRLPQGCARVLEIADESPRVIVTIEGMTAPTLPRSIAIDDANLDRIRLVHDAETSRVELHLVLHLTRPGISVAEMNQVGPHLVVLLTPTGPPTPAP